MRSAWSVALLMAVVAGIGVSGWGGKVHSVAPYVIAGVIVVLAGLMLVVPKRALYFALVGSALLVATGLVAWGGHPELALPMPPLISIVVGLYLAFRAVIARGQERNRRPPAANDD